MRFAMPVAAACGVFLISAACATDFGPTDEFVALPNPVYPGGVKSAFPPPLNGQVRIQSGTSAQPLSNGQDYAINSQAVVSAPWPYEAPSLWSPNEFSVINKGHGRVHGVNNVLIAEDQIDIDNTATFSYVKCKYPYGYSVGGCVGNWTVTDVQGSVNRPVGAEFVTLTGDADFFDNNPQGHLTDDPNAYATQGAFAVGVRVSNLIGSKVLARGYDLVAEQATAGYDTGLNIQSYRSRAIYVHNNMAGSRGGARVALEASPTVPTLFKWQTSDGTPLTLEQNYSGTFGQQYYVFRKDASFNWWAMFPNGVMTFSTDAVNGSKLVVFPDGRIRANHNQTPSFQVKQGGRYYLSDDQQTYIDFNGTNIRLVKHGQVVAQW